MMRFSLTGLLLLLHLSVFSQVFNPVQWKYSFSKSETKVGENVDLIFTAVVEEGWHLYASDFDPNLGPIVLSFKFTPHASYKLIGKIKSIAPKKKYDDIFGGDYTYFEGKGVLKQTVKLLATDPVIGGELTGQACTNSDGRCVQVQDEFQFEGLKVIAGTIPNPEALPNKQTLIKDTVKTSVAAKPVIPPMPDRGLNKINLKLKERGASQEASSLWDFILLAFAAGLLALVTPCVFPMVPMTVTFFTNTSATRGHAIRKAFIYGGSIVGIYGIIGLVISRFNGPEVANVLATHWAPNLLFFFIFLFFGLSFLGLFEITLPSSFVNKVDAQAEKGGIAGVFFMAFTIVLVSFSCTGPIVGNILVLAAGKEILKPVVGMLSYSLAFAIPFTLFAIFPNWLNKLPKSGGWLNVIKVSLGFIELALGLKFFSVADQVYHWNLLDREIYIAIWFVLFLLLGIYLLGKIRLPHDSETHVTTVPRLLLAIASFAFATYLLPGMFGAPLKALSGYLPPLSTHDFDVPGIIRENTPGAGRAQSDSSQCEEPRYADRLHLPHGLRGYFDYKQALKCAREKNIPLFIDFTGHGCVNCREMEANVWSDPAVLAILKKDYQVVALYVDDPKEVPLNEAYISPYDQKKKKTIGAQNADLQIRKYSNNAQPFYVLLDPYTEQPLAQPVGYEGSVVKFLDFLKEGKDNFKLLAKPE